VIDGGKALRKAIVECFGALALIQRLPGAQAAQRDRAPAQELHASVGRALRDAWDGGNAELAKGASESCADTAT
jgi:putative transposase